MKLSKWVKGLIKDASVATLQEFIKNRFNVTFDEPTKKELEQFIKNNLK